MSEPTKTISIRIPKGCVDLIDENIGRYGHLSTRPAYIVFAMENMFRSFVSRRIKLDSDLESMKDMVDGALDPNVILSITKKVLDGFMEKYSAYQGEGVQILLRVPEKFLQDIEDYATVLGFYSDRNDFIRMAIVDQLENDKSMADKMERVREHRTKQKMSSDAIVKSMLSKMEEDPSGIEGLVDIFQKVIKEANGK